MFVTSVCATTFSEKSPPRTAPPRRNSNFLFMFLIFWLIIRFTKGEYVFDFFDVGLVAPPMGNIGRLAGAYAVSNERTEGTAWDYRLALESFFFHKNRAKVRKGMMTDKFFFVFFRFAALPGGAEKAEMLVLRRDSGVFGEGLQIRLNGGL